MRGGGDGTQPPPLVLAESEDEPEFEIECIVAQCGSGWREQYRICWLGYGPEEGWWLPASELTNAQKVLQEWLDRNPT